MSTARGWTGRGLLAAALLAGTGDAQDGGPVDVRVSDHPGKLITVCLETAPPVQGAKRVVVSFGETPVKLATGRDNHGPHCASFDPGEGTFHVRLEQTRYFVATTVVMERDFPKDEYAGKTLTFFWTRE